MKLVLLDARTLEKDADLKIFEPFGELVRYETTSPQESASRLQGATIAITNKVKIGREVMEACPELKLICITATGTDNIDLEAAKALGIEVKNVAGYSTHSVAQHTFALVLELLTHVSYYDGFVKNDGWVQSPIFTHIDNPIREIHGKQWGIIGLGEIGKQVARIAEAFGAKVCYHSTSGKNTQGSYPHLELDALLSTCDIVSIHAPFNAKTKGLIGKKELALMKQDALLINVGRGGIVDEVALKEALEAQKIYAGFDVLAVEPMDPKAPLRSLTCKERLVLTPHVAWASVEARTTLLGLVAKNIETFLRSFHG
ncbi:MAG: D-2-hydroxyacid dehydrogenase [Campylobacterales bacterium]|nr:D-2-hydroxyacid dehydrogenase [Campylobacterales bacterium]